MDNRVVSVIASKKRKKKKKPRPDSLPKLPEVSTGVSTSTPQTDQTNDKPNPSVRAIPQLTVTPPDDDCNPNREIYTPPEVNILSQSSTKRKKKKKKQPVVPVVKDEVRPSVILGYVPRSLRKSVNIQPTVSELEEVCEESENQTECSSFLPQTVPELLEEEDLEDISSNSIESAYGSVESTKIDCISDITPSLNSLSDKENRNQELVASSENSVVFSESAESDSPAEINCATKLSPKEISDTIDANCDFKTEQETGEVPQLQSCEGQSVIVNCLQSEIADCFLDNSSTVVDSAVSPATPQETANLSHQEFIPDEEKQDPQDTVDSSHRQSDCSSCDLESGDKEKVSPLSSPVKVGSTHIDGVSYNSTANKDSSCAVSKTMSESKTKSGQETKAQPKAQKKLPVETKQNNQMPAQDVQGANADNKGTEEQKTKAQLKAERKAAFEAAKGSQLAAQKAQNSQKSKADLRMERRALQDAQRQAKDSGKVTQDPSIQKKPSVPDINQKKSSPAPDDPKTVITISDPPFKKQTAKAVQDKVIVVPQKRHLFSHLPQFQWDSNITSELGLTGKSVHPAIIKAGLKMAQGLISGSDARCVATLEAFRQVITDYSTPPKKELSRDLDSKVKAYKEFLNKCRPLSISMDNAIKQLRWHITQISSTMDDKEAKEKLCTDIDDFVKEQVILSKKAIALNASEKIHDNNVILIYSCSPLVKEVLNKAKEKGKTFRIIVVDARPGLEGREMVRYLVGRKIECSYVLINAVSYVMKEVDLVLLDCHCLQANGYVMSRVGSSQIALVAQASNVPVLVCCETYKFCDRVNTDAFVDNELGNPEDLVTSLPTHKSHLRNWKDMPYLNLINMTYDVTPADLVTAVVTELCTLPCTSVPVVLRVKHKDVQK